MKLLSSIETDRYHEIEVEYKFLFIKWRVKYRKFNAVILKYKEPNKYFNLGMGEYFSIKELFFINP
jgi:hypothetical protein